MNKMLTDNNTILITGRSGSGRCGFLVRWI